MHTKFARVYLLNIILKKYVHLKMYVLLIINDT